jgi:hypothetical protein
MKKFGVARYNFNSLFRQEANKSFIEDLMKEPFIEETNYTYAIGNIHVEEEKGYILTRGTFGRVKNESLGEIYNKKKKEFISKRLPQTADTTLEFVINHENHLLFVELNTRVYPEYFRDKFIQIYERSASHGGLDVEYIFEDKDIYVEIGTWDRIDKIVLSKLRPSNPSTLPSFDNIEKMLKETGSEDTNIQFKAPLPRNGEDGEEDKPDIPGLNPDSVLIREGLSLSAHGYGEAKLVGKKDGIKEGRSRLL